jgi:hypothetical protein
MAMTNRTAIFWLKLLAVGLIVGSLDAALGIGLRQLYFGMNWGKSYRITYALEKASEKLLILGSSRAYCHYVPEILEARTGLSCYNAGHDAAGILYNLALLEGVLSRYHPRRLILDFRPVELVHDARDYQMLSVLLPYYRDHREIRRIIHLRSWAERWKHVSKIYPFNSQIMTILLANKIQWPDDRGFVPLYGSWPNPIEAEPPSRPASLDPNGVASFRRFIALAKKNDIALSVVVSPVYRLLKDGSPSIRAAALICRQQNIGFLDFSQDARFLDKPELFHDPDHLNAEGAKLFSGILADSLGAVAAPGASRRLP